MFVKSALFVCFVTMIFYKTNQKSVVQQTIVSQHHNLDDLLATATKKMDQCPDPHYNQITKETWYVTEDEHSTNGLLFEMYEHIGENGFVNVKHIHPYQSEYILVLQGEIKLLMDRREYKMGVGDQIIIPPGILHEIDNRHYNNETLLLVQYTPSLNNMALLFQTLAKWSHDGTLDSHGIPSKSIFGKNITVPNIVKVACLFHQMPGVYKAWWLPDLLQDIGFKIVAYSASNLGWC
jgi:quercetin dioxygenase-like cupin family protein